MKKVLIPVDASNAARTTASVAEAVRLYAREQVTIHLLSVQIAVSSHVGMFFAPGELDQLQLSAGAEDLAPFKAQLDEAGVPYTASVSIGRTAETIARVAREMGCDRILMGQDGSGNLAGKMFGSLAQQVRLIVSGSGSPNCQVIGS